jgi:hypothetical protein
MAHELCGMGWHQALVQLTLTVTHLQLGGDGPDAIGADQTAARIQVSTWGSKGLHPCWMVPVVSRRPDHFPACQQPVGHEASLRCTGRFPTVYQRASARLRSPPICIGSRPPGPLGALVFVFRKEHCSAASVKSDLLLHRPCVG